jgi:hypothetical protein
MLHNIKTILSNVGIRHVKKGDGTQFPNLPRIQRYHVDRVLARIDELRSVQVEGNEALIDVPRLKIKHRPTKVVPFDPYIDTNYDTYVEPIPFLEKLKEPHDIIMVPATRHQDKCQPHFGRIQEKLLTMEIEETRELRLHHGNLIYNNVIFNHLCNCEECIGDTDRLEQEIIFDGWANFGCSRYGLDETTFLYNVHLRNREFLHDYLDRIDGNVLAIMYRNNMMKLERQWYSVGEREDGNRTAWTGEKILELAEKIGM